jgi:putative (di)nucleoside polyphosphate hydrolase
MTDLSLYRPNVGLALFSDAGLVFMGHRMDDAGDIGWQMPQGGIDEGEALDQAALRELEEETGIPSRLAAPLGGIDDWLTYDFPPDVLAAQRRRGRPWVGQKQRWRAYRFLGADSDVRLDQHQPQEFDEWRWERLERAPDLVIPWKRHVYLEVARAFAPYAAIAG